MIKNIDLEYYNKQFRGISPEEIIEWALQLSKSRIVTTSFGKFSAVLLSTLKKIDPSINVIWCDTGYNLPETYEHAEYLQNRFNFNLKTYVPKETRAFTEHRLGFPSADEPEHYEFSEIVKLEPFRRALEDFKPEVWFTNIRISQTELRSSKNILSQSKEGILKVSPYYYWTDDDLDNYLEVHKLPKNSAYFDPVKAIETRECGIHLQQVVQSFRTEIENPVVDKDILELERKIDESQIKAAIETDFSGSKDAANKLALNEIGEVDLKLSKPIFYDTFVDNKSNGSFILIDEQTNTTAGVGFIN